MSVVGPEGQGKFGPEGEHRYGAVLSAQKLLDAQGMLRDHSREQAAERLAGASVDTLYPDPMVKSDVLGAARLEQAASEQRIASAPFTENVERESLTVIVEALKTIGHIQRTEVDVDADGRAHVGPVYLDRMVLHGLHPEHTDVLNTFGEIDHYAELMSQAHFQNATLRQNRAQVRLSLVPRDREVDAQKLDDWFDLDNGVWMIDWVHFEPKGTGWKRVTQRTFMSGSDPRVASVLLGELGVTDGRQLDSLQVRETSFLLDRSEFAGPATIAQLADRIMSELAERPVFCGKVRDWEPDQEHYDSLAQESMGREASLAKYAGALADTARYLVREGRPDQNQRFADAIILSLRDICKNRPEYAEYVFGREAMDLYGRAKDLRDAGDHAASDRLLQDAFNASTTAVICDIEVSMGGGNSVAVSPFATLYEKYGFDKVHRGTCQACGVKDDVGECSICNVCDTRDRLAPGYAAYMAKRRAAKKKAGSMAVMFGGQAHRLDKGRRQAPRWFSHILSTE